MEPSVFLKRMQQLAELTERDKAAIQALPWSTDRTYRGRDILSVGDRPDYLYVVVSGWAARYGLRRDGSRRITSFMLPGDFCGIHSVAEIAMDHAIVAITDCQVARVRKSYIEQAIHGSPELSKALWHAKAADEAILRMWLLSSRNAEQAVAHLLCELHARMDSFGGVDQGQFELPITQEHIADALGITAVHTNRMLRRLVQAHLIHYGDGRLCIPDLAKLRHHCAFSIGYMHQGQR
ncbi:Crp/Fnr family transcriptional regulator [Sphingomonas beigongshangi]|uniref:Crp/Fnr family transcriptional regulator n=1 Tax=Sphingomonas beigongshangi TaxID=2782540 RepID=UPI001AED4891